MGGAHGVVSFFKPPLSVQSNWGQVPINSRHAGSVAAHRRFAATFASARPPRRLSARQFFSDSISEVKEISLVQRNH
jgi:hypothetical protein